MKAVIPAKVGSIRLPYKNWREFHKGKSLVEIKIEQLKDAGMNPSDIYVFCEDSQKWPIVKGLGARFIHRPEETTKDDMHWSDVVSYIIGSVECSDDETVAWTMATSPLFGADDFRSVFHLWETQQGPFYEGKYDSLITAKPFKEFVIDGNGRPINFSYGRWHEWSQDLPQWFVLDSPLHLMKKKTYMECNYYIGRNPYVFVIPSTHIDIDTEEEFKAAQRLYSSRSDDA